MAAADFPKPRTRIRCYWKGCSFRGTDQESIREHMADHRKCPKHDCESQFDEEKEKRRHVWTKHINWAISVDYPKINGQCDLCGKVYKRGDYVSRHKREEHEGKKRGQK
ncbi:hypothetical protein GQ607_012224 [Colletotrichum asianum]|uniref:C2H2-type domain-containing protein n=1 Tax=Colletotrichum asianum TaxID=702518 RepID=A0A8H3ZIH4_9PEZI|nr:hypothetical protein GQ607_012224 [Colletotrichum asianum]